ncbi:Tkl protein kinase, partial [Globisporangium splendens]
MPSSRRVPRGMRRRLVAIAVCVQLVQLCSGSGEPNVMVTPERDLQTTTDAPTPTMNSSNSAAAAVSLSSSGSSSLDAPSTRRSVTTIAPSSSSEAESNKTTGLSQDGGGGQRYDLMFGVGGVSLVIIAALLCTILRTRKRAGKQTHRDVYKSSADEEPQLESRSSSLSSTWKVGSTNTRTQPRPLSPYSSYVSTAGVTSNSDSDSMSGIWRDPIIAAARIPYEEIRIRTLIRRGGFGEVFEGSFRGRKVAIKRLLPETRKSVEKLEYFMLEVRMMATFDHPRVVEFIGVGWDAMRDLCIVSEFMAHGDLHRVRSKWKQRGEPQGFDAKKLTIALHVAEALVYLHSLSPKKIIHRDLKSANILLSDNWDAKLSDFGVSRERSEQLTRTLTANIGSSLWMAPEIMLGENYDERADLFSFGIVLTELDTHSLPYVNVTTPDGRHLPEPAVLHMVTMGSVQAEFSAQCHPDMASLGRACLSLDPEARPSSLEVVAKIQQMLETL